MCDFISVKKWSRPINLKKQICRICLTLTDLIMPIFQGEGIEQKLESKIQKHLPIQVYPSDVLPVHLCFECVATLVTWDSLVTVCLETNKKFEKFFNELELEQSKEMEVKEHDSDDEPLVPPKKRKLSELKNNYNINFNSNGNNSNSYNDDMVPTFKLNSHNRDDNICNIESINMNTSNGEYNMQSSNYCELDGSRRKKGIPKKVKNKIKADDLNKSSEKKRRCEVKTTETLENDEDEGNAISGGQTNSANNSDYASETNVSGNGQFLTVVKTEAYESEDCETFAIVDDLKDSNDNNPVKCEFCNKSYKDKKYLTRHMKKFHDEAKSFEAQRCDICGNVYKTKANLERHYTKEHLSNQAECPVCHLSVNSKKMNSHLRSIHGVKTKNENDERFKCKFCEKWFKNKYVRNSHVKETHLSEPMKCKLCDFEGVQAVLRRHRRDVHAEKRFPCSLCQGAFKTLHTLKMHMTAHSDLRCYTCDICGMGFKRLNNVRDHMKCHEQKSNQCQICGNFFARKRYLAIHEKTIHNFYADGVIPEEKGFECETCGAKLKWKKNLLAHMRIHTGEKPYVCKICKKDFICHGSLRTHMAKHGVCAASENAMSPMTDGSQDPQNHLALEMNVFTHFNPP